MNITTVLKTSDTLAGLSLDFQRFRRRFGSRRVIVERYIKNNSVRKLHLGAGDSQLTGWLSTDMNPKRNNTVFLDATKRFPFADDTFDYIYSEHMIEHVSWVEGKFMLSECHRVLKKNSGIIRVATPDLSVLLSLYDDHSSPAASKYMQWITDTFITYVDIYRPSFVINNAFHNWGHKFLYDEELLTMALSRAGFVDIARCSSGESSDINLSNIETHGINVDAIEMSEFETMVFEARC